jgi:hypothetical protein
MSNKDTKTGTKPTRKRGRPIKYPRLPTCPHQPKEEHARGVCYACSSSISGAKAKEKLVNESGVNPAASKSGRKKHNKLLNLPQKVDVNSNIDYSPQAGLGCPVSNNNTTVEQDQWILKPPESIIFNFNIRY